jgi:hypothetical protein
VVVIVSPIAVMATIVVIVSKSGQRAGNGQKCQSCQQVPGKYVIHQAPPCANPCNSTNVIAHEPVDAIIKPRFLTFEYIIRRSPGRLRPIHCNRLLTPSLQSISNCRPWIVQREFGQETSGCRPEPPLLEKSLISHNFIVNFRSEVFVAWRSFLMFRLDESVTENIAAGPDVQMCPPKLSAEAAQLLQAASFLGQNMKKYDASGDGVLSFPELQDAMVKSATDEHAWIMLGVVNKKYDALKNAAAGLSSIFEADGISVEDITGAVKTINTKLQVQQFSFALMRGNPTPFELLTRGDGGNLMVNKQDLEEFLKLDASGEGVANGWTPQSADVVQQMLRQWDDPNSAVGRMRDFSSDTSGNFITLQSLAKALNIDLKSSKLEDQVIEVRQQMPWSKCEERTSEEEIGRRPPPN